MPRKRQPIPEYGVWRSMIQRCEYPRRPEYHRYGGRGIRVCPRWRLSFKDFYVDMGPRPSPRHSIDRIDNDGNYEPLNCRWATPEEQQANRSCAVWISHDGRRQTLQQWSDELGIPYATISARLRKGWPEERLLSRPKRYERLLTFRGRTQNVIAWSIELGISRGTITARLHHGWSAERALSTAPRARARRACAGR